MKMAPQRNFITGTVPAPPVTHLLSITNPTIGNHEYIGGSAAGYFDYWNNIPNYYSFDAGGWHFIGLNSNASHIEIIAWAQYAWLSQDLATNSSKCTIVYYHHHLIRYWP